MDGSITATLDFHAAPCALLAQGDAAISALQYANESARLAHQQDMATRVPGVAGLAQTSVESEIVAVITAAIAIILDRPFRLVSVQPLAVSESHLNVWALEGRTQIFHSHKVR